MPKDNIQTEKARLRNEMLTKRTSMLPTEVNSLSSEIRHRLDSIPGITGVASFFGTHPIKNEVDLMPFLASVVEHGQLAAFPRCRDRLLELVEFNSPAQLFIPDRFGILFPDGNVINEIKAIKLLLLPGLAFGRDGGRLGYGRGMLDELCLRIPLARRVGVCYSFQLFPSVPTDDSDVFMHSIVTEKEVVEVSGGL